MPAGKQDEGKQPSFRVSDRRSFAESGEPKAAPSADSAPVDPTDAASQAAVSPAAAPPTAASAPSASVRPPGSEPAADAAATRPAERHRDLPSVDFHTFILSLGSSALLHLGELDPPDGGESRPDLPLAKHTIDIIAMLQEKTKGNLSSPEERLIESLLYDLRLRFVERSKSAGQAS